MVSHKRKLTDLFQVIVCILHFSCLLRLLLLIYLVGFRFLMPGIEEFFQIVTNISIVNNTVLYLLGYSNSLLAVVIFNNFIKFLLINFLIGEEFMNPYLYSVIVLVYSVNSILDHFQYFHLLNGKFNKLFKIIEMIIYPVLTVIEIIAIFNGLKIIDSYWLRLLVLLYVPIRFQIGKELF